MIPAKISPAISPGISWWGTSLFTRAGLRFLGRHPWQLGLALLGVALGVAVVTAVSLANDSATRAFRLSMEAVNGTATHQIVAGPAGLDEALYRRLRLEWSLRESSPVLEAYGRSGDEVLHLLGIDPLAQAGMSNALRPALAVRGDTLTTLLLRPDAALLSARTAGRLGLAPGDGFEVEFGGRRQRLVLAGLLEDEDSQALLDGLLVMDIAAAQEVTGLLGVLSWIDLRLPEGAAGEALKTRIREHLPPGVRLVTAASRSTAQLQMSRAFHTNLTAMSLLALLVGLYLIYNTMNFLTLQRRRQLGILRLLGVTRGELLRQYLFETLLLAAAATALGLLVGVILGRGLLHLVGRTLNDLYFQLTVGSLQLSPSALLLAALLGLSGTLLAALPALLEATATRPAQALQRTRLEGRMHHLAPRLALAGALLVVAGTLTLLLGPGLTAGFTGLFLIILGCSCGVPWVAGRTADVLSRLAPHLLDRLALRSLAAGLSRTGIATAALMLALAAALGVGIMIASFRISVAHWLEATLHADLYVAAPDLGTGRAHGTLDPALQQAILDLPGIRAHSTGRRVTLEREGELIDLFALGLSPGLQPRYPLREALPGVWEDFRAGRGILVSEPLAYARGLAPGATLVLPTDGGDRPFRVLGVYYDYGNPAGQVLMDRALYERHFRDRAVGGLGLYLTEPERAAQIQAAVRRLAAVHGQALRIRSNNEIRARSLEIFDRTFTITRVLRLLAVLVAFLAVFGALLALQLERSRELAILRAAGVTRRGVWRITLVQTGFMGLTAALLALPMGMLLAQLLIFVINRRAFGWTMESHVPVDALGVTVILGLTAAWLAALYPAWRQTRLPPARILREE